ncbi:hypothetical protein CAPTEDRAFT_196778 [Capitella teleta]|uniref:Transposable element P transposase-like RNase H C-terminal domain-containing protein n=1 Tax=Capitella teleta TaxID=283909 RepID=R7TLP4_CAPTE|nr:hypothetical protein CAPTEDRAFT_196778 [Capitella teleta]|eukprot:ELT92471.1 hypothetical protein CAPTEDRAFT_196778 [Capitella teleta]
MMSAGTQWCAGDVMASDRILSSSRAPSPPSGKASTGIQTSTTSTTIPPKLKRQQQKSKEKTIVISVAKPSSIPKPKPAPPSKQGKKRHLPKVERRRLNKYGVLDPDAIDPSLEEDMAVDVLPSTSLTPGKMQSTKEEASLESLHTGTGLWDQNHHGFSCAASCDKKAGLPSYKCSQDHLELLFNVIRRCLGGNNNPTTLQLKAVFRRLIAHCGASVSPSDTGNCKVLDEMQLVTAATSTYVPPNYIDEASECDHCDGMGEEITCRDQCRQ